MRHCEPWKRCQEPFFALSLSYHNSSHAQGNGVRNRFSLILVAFFAYALSVTLEQRLQALAPGLTPRAVLEKLATIQMLDVCLPTTDDRWLIMPRYTQPEPDQALMLHQLNLSLPSQPSPRIKAQEDPVQTVQPKLKM